MSQMTQDLELSANVPDHSDILGDEIFKHVADKSASGPMPDIADELSAHKFDGRITASDQRPVMTSARPEDDDKPLRLAFREFKHALLKSGTRAAIQYLESSPHGAATAKKYAAAIREAVGFYGVIYADANDFNCNDAKRIMLSKRGFQYVVKAGKCGACIHRLGTRCANFCAKLIDSTADIDIDPTEAAFMVTGMTRDKDILDMVKTDPVFALRLALIRESR